MPRLKDYGIKLSITNDLYYNILKDRGIEEVELDHIANIPTGFNPEAYTYTEYVWRKRDNLIRLANRFYNDHTLWVVIGFFNQKPVDHLYNIGETIKIPANVQQILQLIGE